MAGLEDLKQVMTGDAAATAADGTAAPAPVVATTATQP